MSSDQNQEHHLATQETIHSTFDMIREISNAANIKIHRGFTDFLADKIVQAATQPTLLAMIESLTALLNTQLTDLNEKSIAAFMRCVHNRTASAMLAWLREYPRVVAMIVTQKSNKIYEDSIQELNIPLSSEEKGVALPTAIPEISIKITCLSPLAHGADTKVGNATLFRRMQILSTTHHSLSLPFYAGNALRGQMRDLLGDHFLLTLGGIPQTKKPQCRLWFFHTLYAGGVLEENSPQAKALSKKFGNRGDVRPDGVYEFRNMIPPLSLLGAALGNRVLSGRVNFHDFRPQCVEWGNGTIPVGALFEWSYLTRREDQENAHEKNISMITNTECLKTGTTLFGGIDVSAHTTDIEWACLGKGLLLLQKHGYIGAENRRGLGQVSLEVEPLPDPSKYDNYLHTNRVLILTYLKEIGALYASGELNF